MNNKQREALRKMIEDQMPDYIDPKEYRYYIEWRFGYTLYRLEEYKKNHPHRYMRLMRNIKKYEEDTE